VLRKWLAPFEEGCSESGWHLLKRAPFDEGYGRAPFDEGYGRLGGVRPTVYHVPTAFNRFGPIELLHVTFKRNSAARAATRRRCLRDCVRRIHLVIMKIEARTLSGERRARNEGSHQDQGWADDSERPQSMTRPDRSDGNDERRSPNVFGQRRIRNEGSNENQGWPDW
jgi:hypothetical protein